MYIKRFFVNTFTTSHLKGYKKLNDSELRSAAFRDLYGSIHTFRFINKILGLIPLF